MKKVTELHKTLLLNTNNLLDKTLSPHLTWPAAQAQWEARNSIVRKGKVRYAKECNVNLVTSINL